jgi:gliding motility-associated-like protein
MYCSRKKFMKMISRAAIISILVVFGFLMKLQAQELPDAPVVISTAVTVVDEDSPYQYVVEVQDNDSDPGQLTYQLMEGPDWLQLNADYAEYQALLFGTPETPDGSPAYVLFKVSDNTGAFYDHSFSITINAVNDAPNFDSAPVESVTEEEEYVYNVVFSDEESPAGDLLITKLAGPDWLELTGNDGSGNAVLKGTPLVSGNAAVSLEVSDGEKKSTQNFSINIIEVNDKPVFTSTPLTSADEDLLYEYNLSATDEETLPENIEFTLEANANWLTLTNNGNGTARLFGTPPDSKPVDVIITLSDEGGETVQQIFQITVKGVNDDPEITSIEKTTARENEPYLYEITAIDEETSPADLIFTISGKPDWMTFNGNDGSGKAQLIGTPSSGGNFNITITVDDTEGGNDVQTFTLSVEEVNDAPQITSTAITEVTEGSSYSYQVSAIDEETTKANLVFMLTSNATWLTLAPNDGNGNALLSGTPNQAGNFNVTISVKDEQDAQKDQQFQIVVANVNDKPVISSTALTSVNENELYTYTIIANDEETAPQNLSFSLTTPAGWLSLGGNDGTGKAVLSGTPTQAGSVQVKITVADQDGETEEQSFTINVVNVNDKPVITSNPVTTATEDVQYLYDVKATDEETPADNLTFILTEGPDWLTFGNNNNGTIRLSGIPKDEDAGAKSIKITVKDAGGAEMAQTFTLNVARVDDPPAFTSTALLVAEEGKEYLYNISGKDEESDLSALRFSANSLPGWLVLTDNQNGTAVLKGTPGNNNVGNNEITLILTDGSGKTINQNFTINVSDVNNGPIVTSTPITAATEDQPYTYDVKAEDVDDKTPVGQLIFSFDKKPSWLSLGSNNSGVAKLSGTPLNEHAGDNQVIVVVEDGDGLKAFHEFIIKVAPFNDPPRFTSGAVTDAREDQSYNYQVAATDEENQSSIKLTILGKPEWLQFIDNGNGRGLLTGTPLNVHAGNSFEVKIEADDQNGKKVVQTFNILVEPTNDEPFFTSTPKVTGTEDQTYSYTAIASDEETAAGNLIFTIPVRPGWLSVSQNGNGSVTLSGTPTNANVGNNNVTIRVSDGIKQKDQVYVIEVSPVNDAPVFESTPVTNSTEDLNYQYNIKVKDEDNSLNTLNITATQLPAWLTLVDNKNGTAILSGSPSQANVGANIVSLMVSDGLKSNSQTFTIQVLEVNDAPEFISSPVTSAREDQTYTYTVESKDEENNQLTLTATVLPDWLTFTANSLGGGVLTGQPTNAVVGNHQVRLDLTDGNKVIGQSFTISVANVNDAPEFLSNPIRKAIRGEEYNYNIITSDQDAGDVVVLRAKKIPDWLTFTNNENGTGKLSGLPIALGDYQVELEAEDQSGEKAAQNFTINVVLVNNLPIITSDPVIDAIQNQPYAYNVRIEDPDFLDSWNFSAPELPEWLTLKDNKNGTADLTGTPGSDNVGSFPIIVRVTDAAGGEDEQNFIIEVSNVNDPPVFTSTPVLTARADREYTYEISATDPDVMDKLTFSAPSLPGWLSLTDNKDGTATLNGTPADSDTGSVALSILVTDDDGLNAEQNFDLLVEEANSPPEFTSEPVTEVQQENFYQYRITVADPDQEQPLIILAAQKPDWLNFSNNGNGTAILSGTPTESQVGNFQVSLIAEDIVGDKVTQNFTLRVERRNTAPVIISNPVFNVNEDQQYNYSIRANDEDRGDKITFTTVELPEWLSFVDNGDGTALLTGNPQNEDVGNYGIRIRATDQLDAFDEQLFILTVINVNDDPVFTSDPVLVAQVNDGYNYEVVVNDPDLGDEIFIQTEDLPGWLTLLDNGDGTAVLRGQPEVTDQGENTVKLLATDGNGGFAEQTFIIVVNTPPTVNSRTLNILEDQTINFNFESFNASFTDLDGDDLKSIKIISLPEHGVLSHLNSAVVAGQEIAASSLNFLIYDPEDNYSGNDVFSWDGNDGNVYSNDPANLSIIIASVNDPPILEEIEAEVLRYAFKQDLEKTLTETIVVRDDDDEYLQRARVFFQRNYIAEEDELLYETTGNISGSFNEQAGILNLIGEDTKENYEQVLRSIRYKNNNLENPSFEPRTISFSVDDGESESALVKRELELVDELVEVIIPSAFTPDNDGINDSWELENIELYPEVEVRIFTRRGSLVYESQSYSEPWDGVLNNEVLPSGVYYYVIKLNDFGDVYTGTVTLIK